MFLFYMVCTRIIPMFYNSILCLSNSRNVFSLLHTFYCFCDSNLDPAIFLISVKYCSCVIHALIFITADETQLTIYPKFIIENVNV